MSSKKQSKQAKNRSRDAQPLIGQHSVEVQAFGTIVQMPIGLHKDVCKSSVDLLNQILADTMTIRDMYKKHHWQTAGHTFNQLHLLFDKHYVEQAEIVDTIAERVQLLGGLAVAMAADVAEMTQIDRPPMGREEVPVQLSRLLKAHEIIIVDTRKAARKCTDKGDDGTNDVLVSDVLRTNEIQVWFLAEHLVGLPTVHASS